MPRTALPTNRTRKEVISNFPAEIFSYFNVFTGQSYFCLTLPIKTLAYQYQNETCWNKTHSTLAEKATGMSPNLLMRNKAKLLYPDTLINPHFPAFTLMKQCHCSALSQEDIINIKEF